MGQNLILQCLSSTPLITGVTLTVGDMLVGRSSDCGIYIPDRTISRRHAKISVAIGAVTVEDFGSRNGTFVEEVPVASCALRLGQILRFGAVSFRLTDGDGGDQEVESQLSTFEVPVEKRASSAELTTIALSSAQRRVLDLLLKGLSEKEVSQQLHISQHTVHNHAREIYRAAHVHSRAELLARLLPKA
jgi:pSer/pThr/pTyr-binding forkhead associated (FHA) protein